MVKMSDVSTVLVTGGAQRIGASIAKKFHNQGWNVIIHYNTSLKDVELLAASLNDVRPNSVKIVQGDISHEVGTRHIAKESLSAFGRLDVLVNNASVFPTDAAMNGNIFQWESLFRCNTLMPYLLLQCLSSEIAKNNGSVVNLLDTRVLPLNPIPEWTLYSASKAAFYSLTLSAAREYAPLIRVNAVAPGITLPVPGENWDINEIQIMNARNLLNKVGTPSDVAEAVYWMATAPHVTGQVLSVDGGEAVKC